MLSHTIHVIRKRVIKAYASRSYSTMTHIGIARSVVGRNATALLLAANVQIGPLVLEKIITVGPP